MQPSGTLGCSDSTPCMVSESQYTLAKTLVIRGSTARTLGGEAYNPQTRSSHRKFCVESQIQLKNEEKLCPTIIPAPTLVSPTGMPASTSPICMLSRSLGMPAN